MKIIPTNDTIADMEKKAAEYETQVSEASQEEGSIAYRLRDIAAQRLQWIGELKSEK
jgi:hypothetical protein